MKRMMLYNESTKRWEWITVNYVRMPWERIGTRMRWTFRRLVGLYRKTLFPYDPPERVYYFDPDTLNMRDPKRERRMRRRDRRDRMLAKAANALNAMVEMQKFIK